MSNELIAIIGVGVTLAGLILYSHQNLKADLQLQREETRAEFMAVRSEIKAEFNKHLGAINSLREDVNQLHGRVARQEGLLEGLRDAITGARDLVAGPG